MLHHCFVRPNRAQLHVSSTARATVEMALFTCEVLQYSGRLSRAAADSARVNAPSSESELLTVGKLQRVKVARPSLVLCATVSVALAATGSALFKPVNAYCAVSTDHSCCMSLARLCVTGKGSH